jgi:hypothetical protein
MGFETLCVSILALLLGLAALFAGYRFFLLLLPIWGFFAGFFLAVSAVTILFGDGFLATVLAWVVGFIVGLIFSLLSYLFYIAGVAILAGSVGYALGAGLMYAIFDDPAVLAFVVGLVAAILVALATLLLNLQKWVIIAITAVGGASGLFLSAMLLFNVVELSDLGSNPVQAVLNDSWFWFLIWIGLAVMGFIAQAATTRTYVLETPESGRCW